MRWIRKAAVGERVAHQEVAEFIVNARIRNGEPAEQREPQSNHEKKQEQDGQNFMGGKT